jgi:hypothetical protein
MPRLKGSKILKFKDNKNIDSKCNLLKIKIEEYYNKNPELIKKINNIKSGNDKITINLIKFFIFNYCNKFKVIINNVIVYDKFKVITKSYTRKLFSLSNTKKTLTFKIEDQNIILPITMLSVFKWLFRNDIFKYIEENIDIINEEKKKYKDNNNKKEKEIKTE